MRDNRTLLLAESDYRNKKVLIAIDDKSLNTFDGQVMLFTAFNLTSRFCNKIDIQCNPSTKTLCLPPKFYQEKICDVLTQTGLKIDPFGKFSLIQMPEKNYDGVLSIGTSQISLNNQVNIDNDGWIAYLNKPSPHVSQYSNPIGAGVAAGLGVCEIFKKLIPNNSYREQMESLCFSALDYSLNKPDTENPPIPTEVKLGNIQIVGIGAVGSAVIAFLDFLPIRGNIELIDKERVEISNLNRYFIATTEDLKDTNISGSRSRNKVELGADYLSHHKNIEIIKFNGSYEEYVNNNGRGKADVVLPLVDNNNARQIIQMNMPKLSVYGTTGSWTFSVSRQKALEDDCIICRHPNRETKDLPCGIVELAPPEPKEKPVNAAVSFVSALPGILVAGELVKLNYDKEYSQNFLQIDLSSSLQFMQHFKRRPTETCICQAPWFRAVYQKIMAKQ
jgi:hypothetical protein